MTPEQTAARVGKELRRLNGPLPAPPERFALTWFADTPSEIGVDWLVEDFVDRGKLCQIFGESQSGKSFLSLSLNLAIARGVPWFGRHVEQGAVLYVASEAAEGIKQRLRAYQLHHGLEDAVLPFASIGDAPDLMSDDDVAAIIQRGNQLAREAEMPLAMVTIDTVRDSMTGDDNSNQDMSLFHRNCKSIAKATGAAIWTVNHSGHSNKDRVRGASSTYAAVDWEWRCEGKDGTRTLSCSKDREQGKYGLQMAFSLSAIEIGTTKRGKPVTSCIVESVDLPTASNGKAGKPITGQAGLAFKMLQRAIADANETPPASNHVPQGVKAVPVGLWRRYCYQGCHDDGDSTETRKKAFQRSRTTLQNRGLVGLWGEWVWIASADGTGRDMSIDTCPVPSR